MAGGRAKTIPSICTDLYITSTDSFSKQKRYSILSKNSKQSIGSACFNTTLDTAPHLSKRFVILLSKMGYDFISGRCK